MHDLFSGLYSRLVTLMQVLRVASSSKVGLVIA